MCCGKRSLPGTAVTLGKGVLGGRAGRKSYELRVPVSSVTEDVYAGTHLSLEFEYRLGI